MTEINYVFGLDFGTSKTAVARARADVANPTADPVDIQGAGHRIPTCVLVDSVNNRVHIGDEAEQEYFLIRNDAAALNAFKFYSNFKPHIQKSTECYEIALMFLKKLRQADRLDEKFGSSKSAIAVGCPVLWEGREARKLCSLLKDAGFRAPFAIAEPVGAAFYFLGGQLRPEDFHHDIVVVDWGAGTFDMTILRANRMEIENRNTYGSNIYGGRLFDDLFYQWLLEMARKSGRHEELRKLTARPINLAYLHAMKCREIKEAFSRHYSRNRNAPERPWTWTTPIVLGSGQDSINLGDFAVEKVAEFDERTKSYRASDMVKQWLSLCAKDARPEEQEFVAALQAGDVVDLKAWGFRLIECGVEELRVGESAKAVLTGGSCNWRWFYDYLRSMEPFAGRSDAILRDDAPELTIARGLARVYAVGSYSRNLIKTIESRRPKLRKELERLYTELLMGEEGANLSHSIMRLMKYDQKLVDEFDEIVRRGLEQEQADSKRQRWIERRRNAIIKHEAAVRSDIQELLKKWVGDHGNEMGRAVERFSTEAGRRINKNVLKNTVGETGGLIEVAIEACGPTGQSSFGEALEKLGENFHLGRNIWSVLTERIKRLRDILSGKQAVKEDDRLEQQIRQVRQRFFEELPSEIERSILRVLSRRHWPKHVLGRRMPAKIERRILRGQSREQWAEHVLGRLIETLETLVRIARVDQAEEAARESK
jgi:hypothetical protein